MVSVDGHTLPTGTITLCFTDVAGSTQLWERQPDRVDEALRLHDALLRQECARFGGHVFKTVGDQFCMAFDRASDAVGAAGAIQHRLEVAPWNQDGLIAVRIAIHTGTASEREGDYFGPSVNRVARLLSSGHGGQVLISRAARELSAQVPQPEYSVIDLGEHRLRDLSEPERIYQLVGPNLARDFPPLKTLNSRKTNLPVQLTTFIGREAECKAIGDMLTDSGRRLITLTGAGGSGKTRLALQVAAEVSDAFDGGVYLVELAPLSSAAEIPRAVLGALKVLGVAATDEAQVMEAIGDSSMLLILDNFEHLLPDIGVVRQLLRQCPRLHVLTTSRLALRVQGDHTFPVRPLAAPPRTDEPLSAEDAMRFEAVQLFATRAKAARFDFAVTEETAPIVAAICARLDGLPLAIELAAARIRTLEPRDVLSWFDRPGGTLKVLEARGAETPRHESLRATIRWSDGLLVDEASRLLRRLSIFRGGAALDAIVDICELNPVAQLEGLEALVDVSLIHEHSAPDGRSRYDMLETIREYAAESLPNTDRETLGDRHARYFLRLAERLRDWGVAHDRHALDLMEADHENFLAAIRYLLNEEDRTAASVLAGAIRRLWLVRGFAAQGRRILNQVLPSDDEDLVATDFRALDSAVALADLQTDLKSAESLAKRLLRLVDRLGLEDQRSTALVRYGCIHWRRGQYGDAIAVFESALDAAHKTGNQEQIAIAANYLALVFGSRGDHELAIPALQDAVEAYTTLGNQLNRAAALSSLGSVQMGLGHFEAATSSYTQALEDYGDLEDTRGQAIARGSLGYLARQEGRLDDALVLLKEALSESADVGEMAQAALTMMFLAATIVSDGDTPTAAMLWAASDRIREDSGVPLEALEAAQHQADVNVARQNVTLEQWESAMERGRELSSEDAIRLALEWCPPSD
jgi:predicted ATPase/class 3 adenylate cyclase